MEILTKLEKYLSNYVSPHPNYDCSEIAEDFRKSAGGKGTIVIITSKSGLLRVIENGNIVEFEYHEVFLFNGFVYDPRSSKKPIKWEQYVSTLENLNKGKQLKFRYK